MSDPADPTSDPIESSAAPGYHPSVDPWSWVPPEWQHPHIDAEGIDELFKDVHPEEMIPVHDDHHAAIMALQPGVGIPSSTLDSAASSAPAIDWDQSAASATVGAMPSAPAPLPGVVDGLGMPGAPQPPDSGNPDAGGYPTHPLEVPGSPDSIHQGEPYGAPAVGPMPLDAQGQLVSPPAPKHEDGTLRSYTDAEIQKIAATDPQQALQILLDDRQNRSRRQALLEEQQAVEERAAIEKDAADRQAAMAHVQKKQDANDAAITAWMNKTVDPDRLMRGRSFIGKLIDGIGAFASSAGAGPGAKGNSYIDWLQQDVATDIKAQEGDLLRQGEGLQRKNSILSEEFARTGNLADAKHVATMALLGISRNAITTKMQEFDPAGARVVPYLQGLQQINATMAQQQHLKAESDFKKFMDERKQSDEEQKTAILGSANMLAWKKEGFTEAQKMAGGIGGGAAKDEPIYGKVYASLNDIPEKFRKMGVRLPGKNGTLGGFFIAGNEEAQKGAQDLVGEYEKANHDLNELQKISMRRKGAMSTAGSFTDAWKDTDEQHYKALLTDVANVYGKMIHGRAPTAGVMDEVLLHSIPELKKAWEGGDTTELLNRFRNDIDNRTSLQLHSLGSDSNVTSDRPKIETQNANTIKATLVSAPVKGDAGYAHIDVKNVDGQIEQLFQHHLQNPSLGGQKAYESDLKDVEEAQRSAMVKISSDIAKLSAKPKPTAQDQAQLKAATAAMADRVQVVDAIHDAKKRSVEHETDQAKTRVQNETQRTPVRHR